MHLPRAAFLARRFRDRGETLDDLVQVGTIGLIKAVDRFDPERGVEFSTYATPTIVGEIKRHFRDKGWAIRVPRRLQELRMHHRPGHRRADPDTGSLPHRGRARRAHRRHRGGRCSRASSRAGLLHAVRTRSPATRRDEALLARRHARRATTPDSSTWRSASRSSPCWPACPPREQRILAAAVLREHDPVADRRGDRRLADARLPAAGEDPGTLRTGLVEPTA